MINFPAISIRQPKHYDIVDDPIRICGVSTTFEATLHARIRDYQGKELCHNFFTAGGSNGILANFHIKLLLDNIPETPLLTLEVFELSAKDGSEINKVVVRIILGRALVDPYIGFSQYTVKSGDTLFSIAKKFYGDGKLYPRIFEANRDQLNDPKRILRGQILRVPIGG